MSPALIITCEHAGNEVPKEYRHLFAGKTDLLATHKGWDPGAWQLAIFLADQFNVPVFGCHTTRLLIEANRSPESEQLFSEFTTPLAASEKAKLIQQIYQPYRESVLAAIEKASKPLLHLSMHSFTPVWNGAERKVDIGILFDPARESENPFAAKLRDRFQYHLPQLVISFNEPYKGTDDGFTTWLRKRYPANEYIGIEIEVNQKFAYRLSDIQQAIQAAVAESLEAISTKPNDGK